MKPRTDLRSVTGPERAAILMLALDEGRTGKLFALMDNDEIKEVSQWMISLGSVPSDVVERLFVEFSEQISSTGSLVGTHRSVMKLLSGCLPQERVEAIMEEMSGPAGRTMWDKLGNVNEMALARHLNNELPQTAAVILSNIKSEHAARILALFPEDRAVEVIMRMLQMEPMQNEFVDIIEATLRDEFVTSLARTSRHDSHELMADIFNNLDRATEEQFLKALEQRNKDDAERIRALMFTFEDLTKLDPGAIQTLLREVNKRKLAMALKGASEHTRNVFFGNMSTTAGKVLREDIEAMGPLRLRTVDEAQTYVIALAKKLAAKGDFIIADQKGVDDLVY